MTLIYIIITSLLISFLSLVGLFTLSLKQAVLKKSLMLMVALSAGSLMGGVFFHLLPEALAELPQEQVFLALLGSFILFFLVEKILHWRHCHHSHCEVHTFGYMNLLGDAVHNFIDGLVIAAAFMNSSNLGIVTSFAIAAHELPQEIGDFGVLLHAGFSRRQALGFNFLTALTALLGAISGYFLFTLAEDLIIYLLPFAAGGFLYIATVDLLPELRKELQVKKVVASLLTFMLGLAFMYLLKE
ncbi:MAG: ZIP family metal transporter [Candidatus Pacebacteria bacterium]|nr:ZIP family metal transporter [Candidatus Paceibacterota bacterium]